MKLTRKHRLIGINSASLVLALLANLALLLNMARRLSFAIAQSITIIGWFIASFLLIALVSVASTSSFRIQPYDQHALSQAYYYGIIAAALYFIISSLMVVTVYGAWTGHYPKEFRLTVSQRTLMLQTIMFMIYLLLGACIYCYIEDWQYLDAVFWADFTLLTIGIGDETVPKTHLGRGLLFPYAIGGIVTVGLVVGSIRGLVLERAKTKMEARLTEKRRERVLKTADSHKRSIKVGHFKTIDFNEEGLTEAQRREQEFNIMRKIQKDASSRRRWMALMVSTLATAFLWFIGALVFHYSEASQDLSYFQALYFAYTSLLTIGYGDYEPSSNAGRPFFVFWTLLAVPTLTILISNMGDTVVKAVSEVTNLAGALTILPGEGGIRASIKETMKKFHGRVSNTSEYRVDQPPGFLMHGNDTAEKDAEKRHRLLEDTMIDRIAGHLAEEEKTQADEFNDEGDAVERDRHFYHYVLAREMRKVMRDVNDSPPKQYSYEEWSYYLRLIGQDETDPELHREPQVKPKRNQDVGEGGGKMRPPGSTPSSDNEVGTRQMKWSWLGTRSPLMDTLNEAEWILSRLTAVLETELSKTHNGNQKEPPPIRMSELRQRIKESYPKKKREEDEGSNGVDKKSQ